MWSGGRPVTRSGAVAVRFWAILVVLAASSGCAEPTASAGTPDDPHLITLASAGPQGRYFKEVSLMSKMLTDKMPGVIANGVIGKGMSVGNLKRVAAGKIDGGRFFRFDLENAYERKLQFALLIRGVTAFARFREVSFSLDPSTAYGRTPNVGFSARQSDGAE